MGRWTGWSTVCQGPDEVKWSNDHTWKSIIEHHDEVQGDQIEMHESI